MNARTTNFAQGEQMKRGRRFSVQLRDNPFEQLRLLSITNQRSMSNEAAQIIERALKRSSRKAQKESV